MKRRSNIIVAFVDFKTQSVHVLDPQFKGLARMTEEKREFHVEEGAKWAAQKFVDDYLQFHRIMPQARTLARQMFEVRSDREIYKIRGLLHIVEAQHFDAFIIERGWHVIRYERFDGRSLDRIPQSA